MRPNSSSDDATPNPNAVAAQNLVRLAGFTGQHAWRDQVDRLFDGLLPLAADNVFMHVALLNALDLRLRGAEIVITGTGDRADVLVAAALKLPFLDRIVIRAPSKDALPGTHPAAAKIGATTEPAAFICSGETCSLPVTTPEQIAATMMAMRARLASQGRSFFTTVQDYRRAPRLSARARAVTLALGVSGGGDHADGHA